MPAVIGSLEKAPFSPVFKGCPLRFSPFNGALPHGRKAGFLYNSGNDLLRHLNLQEVFHPLNLFPGIGQHVCIVKKLNVIQITVVPPGLSVVHITPKREALTFPLKPTLSNPVAPK